MMNTKQTLTLVASTFLCLALLGQGCPTPPTPNEPVSTTQETAMPNEAGMGTTPQQETDDTMMPKNEPAMEKTDGTMESRKASTYEPFTKAKYDAALAEGKPILLFFYANWCPFCKEQDPRFARVIPTHDGGVVALRVNYNDTETEADEKALASELGVTYQHTMFFIGRDGQTKKKAIGTITDAQTIEYLDLISN